MIRRSSPWLEYDSYIWSGLALSALTDSRYYETIIRRSLTEPVSADEQLLTLLLVVW